MNILDHRSRVAPLAFLRGKHGTDREAIGALYLSYRDLFIEVARRYFGQNDAEVEDAVAAAAERLCKYYDKVKLVPRKKMRLYMVNMIRNVCRDRLKELQAEQAMCCEEAEAGAIDQIPDPHGGVGVLFDRANALILLDSFENLSSREKELIRMRHIDHYSIEEIADQLHMTPNAVYTALSRAKARLEKAASLSAKE